MASKVESPSPVTWHVALWVLLSLAINSMSQPAGKMFVFPARYRLYLSSSPIVCCADALSILLEWVTTSTYLRVSPVTAATLVRGRRLGQESPNYNVQRHSTWPRWLFFIIGVLPAAIKLASFSGTPWTQVWGMMFLGSFTTIELISVKGDAELSNSPSLSREAIDLPEAIEYRDRKVDLNNSFELFGLFLFVVAILCHIVLGIKIYWSLWVPFYHEFEKSPLVQAITVYANIVIYVPLIAILVLTPLVAIILRYCGHTAFQQRYIPVESILNKAFFAMWATLALSPRRLSERKNDPPPWGQAERQGILWLAALNAVGYWILREVCCWFPGVARVLLIATDPEVVDGEHVDGDREMENVSPLRVDAFLGLSLFLTNLGLCIFWYAFNYDPTGTVNPAWTDVFG